VVLRLLCTFNGVFLQKFLFALLLVVKIDGHIVPHVRAT
jgi:hypothetical protein